MSERKYRQRGYQDPDDSGRPRSRPVVRAPGEGPRGRGLGAPSRTVFRCRDCGKVCADPAPAPGATCQGCGAALHACVNCAHFDPSSRNECRQPVEERVPSKTKANACELFSPKLVAELGDEARGPSDPRAAFDALFE